MVKLTEWDQDNFNYGYEDFVSGGEPPDPEEHGEYYMQGWLKARQDAGLDPVSLNKLRLQLGALGFTIPNEEN